MENLDTLRRYGLFDARVPRYTSYPPANRFELDTGQRNQQAWLRATPPDRPVSVYIHIPFCKRLCWFCACRTQGTKTLGPLEAYIETLVAELEAAAQHLPDHRTMARLHLGGGTPTLLSPAQMERLLESVHKVFPATEDFAFSVEVDPTEAAQEGLETLAKWGLSRASIGIQDFDPDVQSAIGRPQTFAQTRACISALRDLGVRSLNVDLLYGLPRQDVSTLDVTLQNVLRLQPDRIALYGYAHVPHVSKRQVMIDADALPSVEARFRLARYAAHCLTQAGYCALGLDHFAIGQDSLLTAARAGNLRRNFQGYTDDTCPTLLGFGASAISKFPEGYCQNAVSTAAYTARVQEAGLAGHKGYAMEPEDEIIARMIEMLMCDFKIDRAQIEAEFAGPNPLLEETLDTLTRLYPEAITPSSQGVHINAGFETAARIMAAAIDTSTIDPSRHSIAV